MHIKGPDNVWAGLFGHWYHPSTVHLIIRILELPSSLKDDFDCPTDEEVIKIQEAADTERPRYLCKIDEL